MIYKNKTFQRISNFVKFALTSEFFLIIIGVFSILPFIILTIYNHPMADDYTYHLESMNRGFWNAQIRLYTEISSKYFASFILSIKPLVSKGFYWLSGATAYQLSSVLAVFLFVSIINLLNTKKIKYLLSSVVFFVYCDWVE